MQQNFDHLINNKINVENIFIKFYLFPWEKIPEHSVSALLLALTFRYQNCSNILSRTNTDRSSQGLPDVMPGFNVSSHFVLPLPLIVKVILVWRNQTKITSAVPHLNYSLFPPVHCSLILTFCCWKKSAFIYNNKSSLKFMWKCMKLFEQNYS